MTTIECWRGSDDHSRTGYWYSDREDHASYFGPPRRYRLSTAASLVVTLDADALIDAGIDEYGEAGSGLRQHVESLGAVLAILQGWEGGTCYFVADERCVEIEEID